MSRLSNGSPSPSKSSSRNRRSSGKESRLPYQSSHSLLFDSIYTLYFTIYGEFFELPYRGMPGIDKARSVALLLVFVAAGLSGEFFLAGRWCPEF